jgi:hypothetical protein
LTAVNDLPARDIQLHLSLRLLFIGAHPGVPNVARRRARSPYNAGPVCLVRRINRASGI